MKERIEIRDGREFVVTTLPSDRRLRPSATKKRQMFAALTSAQKREHIRSRVRKAKKRRRKRR